MLSRAMRLSLIVGLAAASLTLVACASSNEAQNPGAAPSAVSSDRYQATDALRADLRADLGTFDLVVTIDHARLAAAQGETMPPAVVTIFSDPEVSTELMLSNPRVGLDLPFKVLVFDDMGTPTVAYPTASFLAARHGLTDEKVLERYDSAMFTALRGIDHDDLALVGAASVSRDYGIAELESDFEFAETIARLEQAVMSQGDTVWFGQVDFSAEAALQGEALSPATLLLFGGPKPGAVAMAHFPKLGLDAFCQKLLVYEDEAGEVKVLFNEIVAFAELHYGTSARPHRMIDGRLLTTFEGAVRRM